MSSELRSDYSQSVPNLSTVWQWPKPYQNKGNTNHSLKHGYDLSDIDVLNRDVKFNQKQLVFCYFLLNLDLSKSQWLSGQRSINIRRIRWERVETFSKSQHVVATQARFPLGKSFISWNGISTQVRWLQTHKRVTSNWKKSTPWRRI